MDVATRLLSNAQWPLIEDMSPRSSAQPGREFSDARLMVEAIIYRYRGGTAWRDLAEVFGPGRRYGRGITGWRPPAPGTRCRRSSPPQPMRRRRCEAQLESLLEASPWKTGRLCCHT